METTYYRPDQQSGPDHNKQQDNNVRLNVSAATTISIQSPHHHHLHREHQHQHQHPHQHQHHHEQQSANVVDTLINNVKKQHDNNNLLGPLSPSSASNSSHSSMSSHGAPISDASERDITAHHHNHNHDDDHHHRATSSSPPSSYNSSYGSNSGQKLTTTTTTINNQSVNSITAEIPGGVVTTQNISTVIRPKSNNNSLQFVKINTPELSKKAVEQIKLAQETKISRDKIKEVEEEWQNNLLNWKSKRRQQFVHSFTNNDDDQLNNSSQLDNTNETPRKVKTFAEILEERARSGTRIGYNLQKYIIPTEDEDETDPLTDKIKSEHTQRLSEEVPIDELPVPDREPLRSSSPNVVNRSSDTIAADCSVAKQNNNPSDDDDDVDDDDDDDDDENGDDDDETTDRTLECEVKKDENVFIVNNNISNTTQTNKLPNIAYNLQNKYIAPTENDNEKSNQTADQIDSGTQRLSGNVLDKPTVPNRLQPLKNPNVVYSSSDTKAAHSIVQQNSHSDDLTANRSFECKLDKFRNVFQVNNNNNTETTKLPNMGYNLQKYIRPTEEADQLTDQVVSNTRRLSGIVLNKPAVPNREHLRNSNVVFNSNAMTNSLAKQNSQLDNMSTNRTVEFKPKKDKNAFMINNNTEPIKLPNPLPDKQNATGPEKKGVLSVSCRKRCSSCGEELGRGAAAFVVESLSLYYHTSCFRCSVCHVQLSNGFRGVDVRVHANALHCQNCYSKDGLNYSRV